MTHFTSLPTVDQVFALYQQHGICPISMTADNVTITVEEHKTRFSVLGVMEAEISSSLLAPGSYGAMFSAADNEGESFEVMVSFCHGPARTFMDIVYKARARHLACVEVSPSFPALD